jgi:hypothetical protein
MRRVFIALVVVTAFAGSAIAQEQKATRVTKKDVQAVVDAAPLMPLTLATLFTVAGDQLLADGVFIPNEMPNIVVAKKNADGTLSTTCVTSEGAAQKFIERKQQTEPSRPAEQ